MTFKMTQEELETKYDKVILGHMIHLNTLGYTKIDYQVAYVHNYNGNIETLSSISEVYQLIPEDQFNDTPNLIIFNFDTPKEIYWFPINTSLFQPENDVYSAIAHGISFQTIGIKGKRIARCSILNKKRDVITECMKFHLNEYKDNFFLVSESKFDLFVKMQKHKEHMVHLYSERMNEILANLQIKSFN